MTPLLDVAIRSSALLLLGLAVNATWRHRSAALRHCALGACIAAAALVAPLGRVLPEWVIPTPGWTIATSDAKGSVAAMSPVLPDPPQSADGVVGDRPAAGDGTVAWALVAIWGAGFAFAIGLLAVRIQRLAHITRRGQRIEDGRWTAVADGVSAAYGLRRPLTFVQVDAADLIATWGVFSPRVLVPPEARGWSDDRLRTVLCHELAHVRRHDWVVHIAAEVVRALYWFNPLMSLACRQLRRESEHACDDAVLAAGVPAPAYASHLLDLANGCRAGRPWATAMPMARRSTLERRIAAMLNTGLDHRPPTVRAAAVTIALLVSAALPIAALRAQNVPRPLTGSIYDSTGAVIPGVTLSLQDAQEFKWETVTDSAGQFEFPTVQPGRYVLEASLPGFRNLRHEFDLKGGRDWERAITMPVGDLTETVTVSASRTVRPPQATGPTRVRVGGNIKAPMKIVNVNPIFPVSMREAGLSGVVPIEAVIGVDGAVLSARVRGAHVHPDFATAALDAVRQWRFTPTLLNGAPVDVVMSVSVNFTLAD